MARVTIEDCLEVIDNRFELVLLSARRARQLARGAYTSLEGDEQDDKPTVLALREIATRAIDEDTIEEVERQEQERREREALEWAAAEIEDDLLKGDDV